jgi:16S rRNA (guanine527-N7)-methyltransferase
MNPHSFVMANPLTTMDFSTESRERLNRYAEALRQWNARINLVSKDTIATLETRHIQDAAQLWPRIKAIADGLPEGRCRLVDLGSGAGIPGVILAILGHCDVTLIESDQRKAAFLRYIRASLGLRLNVICARIAEVHPTEPHGITARGFASLPAILEETRAWWHSGLRYWLWKGENFREEWERGCRSYAFETVAHPSATRAGSAILEIHSLQREIPPCVSLPLRIKKGE